MSRRARLRYLATTGLKRRSRDLVVRPDASEFVAREDLARRYLAGDGLEIGAASWPLRVPKGVRVTYVDYLPREQLIETYAVCFELSGVDPEGVPENIVDDAETLATIADASVDFVIANHVIEHLQDPVRALRNLCRVVRPGGVVFITLPDPKASFDNRRPRTTVAHVLRDHEEGPEVSRREHYEEWSTYIDGSGTGHEDRMARYERNDERHHFHVWELEDFLELVRALDLPASLEVGQVNGPLEFSVVLRRQKTPGGPPRPAAG